MAERLTPAEADSLFVRACRRESVERTPVWFMRQAGRYMAPYRALRAKHSLLELCTVPELAAEVTLQPIAALNVDAAIIFSDILVPLVPMGLELDYVAGEGPVIANPIRSAADVERLQPVEIAESLAFVSRAIEMARGELNGMPLIGFAGAPFTLASYAIEGGVSRTHLLTKEFMYAEPKAWHDLMARLARVVGDLLVAQADAGAAVLQLFDSWVGFLGREDYVEFVLPHSRRVLDRVRELGVPSVHFGVGTGGMLEQLHQAGGDVIGVDWRTPIGPVWDRLGGKAAVQGNLDPAALFGPRDLLRRRVESILSETEGRVGHVFNLGHGIHPGTPVDNVQYVVDVVREFTG